MTAPGRLGDYEVLRRIGTGGMAEIFLCTKRGAKGTEKRLVVKRLLPQHARSDRLRTMFIHEAHLAIRLAHPNLVHCYELADDPEGGLLLAMEYVDGADLGRILSELKKRGERLPDVVALRIVEQAARGLHYAHEYRDEDATETLAIVHRDISPQNILVSRGGVVKVADLGVASARFVRDETGVQPGKLRYMSPEQARGEKVDRRCDVYALGVVLYELLRVTSPYGDRKGAALARAVTHGKLEPPLAKVTDIAGDVRTILEGALAPDPARRTRTARELADAIAQVIFARGTQVDEQSVEAALAPWIAAVGQLGSSRGSTSEDAVSAGVSASSNSGGSSSGGANSGPGPADDPSSDSGSGSDADDVATVAAAPRGRPRDGELRGTAGLRPGDAFDRYVLEGRIGHGGMAEVFRARDTRLRREVALKLLRTDSDAASRSRMLLEAQSAATFEHPGSVVVFDVGEHDGVPFIAMELIRGRTLSTYLGDAEVPIARRIRWSAAIARVLAAAHRSGLVHRDVKPSNVMIKEDGEVKVLDFGIVRRRIGDGTGTNVEALTAAGSIVGTPGYASPEQLRGDMVDGRADQFAWAVTTYEMLAGRRPWTADSTGVLVAQMLLSPFEPLAAIAPDVPAPVVAAIERALRREPEDRFASMDEIAEILGPFCEPDPLPAARGPYASYSNLPLIGDSSTTLPRPPAIPDSLFAAATPGPRAPWRLRWALSFAAAALLGGLAAFFLTRDRGSDAQITAAATASTRVAPVVSSLRCQPAEIEVIAAPDAGPGALDPDVARALGVGACARLAVELGVPWAVLDSPHALRVRVKIGGGAPARADIDLDGETAAGNAREPMRAIDLAVAALRPKLAPPPLTPEEIRAWGANDEAGARRIARVFQRRDLRITADIGADAVRLLETDGDSPFSHLLVLMISAGSGEVLAKARERTLERLDRLPLSRQHLVRGLLMAYPAEVDRKEAARLIRQSYAEAPNDAEMVGLYITLGTRLGLPESFGVLDRMIGSAPTHCVVPLENAILRAPDDDVERALRYAATWIEILPEARASQPVVQAYLRAGKLEDARRSIDFGRQLGLSSMAEPVTYEGGLMDIELVGLETDRARERARTVLADPRPFARSLGAAVLVSAHFLDGHARDALSALASGVKLGMDSGDVEGTAALVTRALAASRWLQLPSVEAAQIDWLREKASAQDQLLRAERAAALVEIALATKGAEGERLRSSTLDAIEAEAASSKDDRVLHDDLLMQSIPLVRKVRGDKAAAAIFREAERARAIVRARSHVDAALAFEALGEPAAAAKAYAIFADPALIRHSGLEHAIAAVRLHKLGAAAGPVAAAFAALYDKLQKSADPGLIEAIEKLR
ncbi:MAG: serine/threonine-protein kinase [Polyangiaceae bacterium]